MSITSRDGLGSPRDTAGACLRILVLVSAHNGLSQRAEIALRELGHSVTVEVVETGEQMERAVDRCEPQLIVCPFLKKMIPESIWTRHRCLVVHPGPRGDRGPSSLDWAIELGMREWGVTVLEANGEFDAGAVWASRTFEMREAPKSSLYRHEVRRAAVAALVEAIDRIARGAGRPPTPVGDSGGQSRPLMVQDDRRIDWSVDSTEVVLRKLRAGEGHPGVLDAVAGIEFYLFGGYRESVLHARPGEVIAQRNGAICRSTVDGAVWITHLKQSDTPTRRFFKLPATHALALAGRELDVPEVVSPWRGGVPADRTYREIVYQERAGVGYLQFEFYNGAMSTAQCERLRQAYDYARERSLIKVIVLMGGRDYFSHGIHLNMIEAAENPAEESWRNLRAIDDVVHEIIATDSHLVIAALGGDAGAGGVPLALAADYVVAREDVVLNPYYRHMGGLYGSEYWTYLLPRRVGVNTAARITGPPFTALGAHEAVGLRLLDDAFGATWDEFQVQTRVLAERLASDRRLPTWLEHKRRQRAHDEQIRPLQAYREAELERCHACFFGPDPAYHRARRRFVYKLPASQPDPGVLIHPPGEPLAARRFPPPPPGHRRIDDDNRYQMRGRAR